MVLPIVILGAGASSRMGGADKLMQIVDGRPLIRRQADIALEAALGPVIVTLPPGPHPREAALQGLDLRIVPVADAAEGMNASLRAGLAALPACDAAMILLGDLPDLTVDDLKIVAQNIDTKSDILVWRGASQTGAPGHPVVFRATLFPALQALAGDGGGREAVALAGDRVRLIPLPEDRARADLDTVAAWENWRRRNPSRAE
jgi:CTP:molybdopterin cytidylyltransferase MocA